MPPRLLACVPDLSASLGVGRVYSGSADALRRLGWTVDYLAPQDLAPHLTTATTEEYRQALRARLRTLAADYDCVEYCYATLPFPRSEFPSGPVFVARSVLLEHHLKDFTIPYLAHAPRRIATYLRSRLPLRPKGWNLDEHLARCDATMAAADLISVASPRDRGKLVSLGLPAAKIAVLPYGLNAEDLATLGEVSPAAGEPPRAVFLGTFDSRKGGAEMPRIFASLQRRVPNLRLRLLGTAGLHATAQEVAAFFPRRLRSQLEIFPRFDRSELPELLSGCSLGLFPSYLESFGFSVVEKLAAGVPVVAYDVPGPGDLLPRDWLAPRGQWKQLADRAARLLSDPSALAAARIEARTQAARWTWDQSARLTAEAYLAARPVVTGS